MKMFARIKVFLFALSAVPLVSLLLLACAGERQGLVCSEIQYRLDTQTYSPDQRAYIEEELRVCREEEAAKRGSDAATRQSFYERYAASDTSSHVDSTKSVAEALGDSSGEKTVSIYERYGAATDTVKPAENSSDTSAADADTFQ